MTLKRDYVKNQQTYTCRLKPLAQKKLATVIQKFKDIGSKFQVTYLKVKEVPTMN